MSRQSWTMTVGFACATFVVGCSGGASSASSDGGTTHAETGGPSKDASRAADARSVDSSSSKDTGTTPEASASTDGAAVDSGHDAPAACGGDAAPCADGRTCAKATDCASLACTGGVCVTATSTDGIKDDSETDVDCGGALLATGQPNPASDGAPACADHKKCILGTDCIDLVCAPAPLASGSGSADGGPIDCSSGQSCTCQPPTAADGVKNDSETGIDCGGALLASGQSNLASDGAPVCQYQTSEGCLLGLDCNSGVCNDNAGAGGPPVNCPTGDTCACQAPSPTDTVANGGETDVDCGGATTAGSDGAPACAPGKKCAIAGDCTSDVCANKVCATPTATDGKKNGGETDVDCGGTPPIPPVCVPTATADCAPACADNKTCAADTDCLSAYCSELTHKCVDGQSCKGLIAPAAIMDISKHASTTPGGADAEGTPNANGAGQHAGLDTCGAGESTDPVAMQSHESCCKSLVIPSVAPSCSSTVACPGALVCSSKTTTAGTCQCSSTAACPSGESCTSKTTTPGVCQVRMDKYEVTTGRVRQFVESIKKLEGDYDLATWVAAQFNATFSAATTPVGAELLQMIPVTGSNAVVALYPTSSASTTKTYLNVVAQLGATTIDEGYPSTAQGCFTGVDAFGAGTYWWDSTSLDDVVGSPPRPFTQDYYDIKPQNCAPYWIAAAFCAWDGGRLATAAETLAVYGSGPYPWVAGTTVPPIVFNPATDTTPAGELAIQAENAHFAITNYTVNYHNSNLGNAMGEGDFYFYPSYALSNPQTGPLKTGAIIDTLSMGLDLSPYISAPGRFTPDLTTARSTDNEGWMDYGADMMEYGEAPTFAPTANTVYCDTTSPSKILTPAEVMGGATCPSCSRLEMGGGNTDCGTTRLTGIAYAPWEGGSWEGHPIELTRSLPMQTQYGKAGFRCVRPLEP